MERRTRDPHRERWIQLIGFSILGGIFLGMFLSSLNKPLIFVREADAATTTPEKVVQIEVVYTWNKERIKQEIRNTFPEDPETALKIAKCESGYVVDQVGHTSPDYGLFQINAPSWDKKAKAMGYGEYKTNPVHNLAMARYLYDHSGWTPWVCYTNHMI